MVRRATTYPRSAVARNLRFAGGACQPQPCLARHRCARGGSCLVADDRRNLPGQPATAYPSATPVTFSTFFTSLRIPNPEITSATPRMISQVPTTKASVTIESNG